MRCGYSDAQHTSTVRVGLEALQDSLHGYGLLPKHDEDELRAHAPKSVDTRTEGNNLALRFCRSHQHTFGPV